MNMLIRKISLAFILSASTLAAFANPGPPRGEREAVREVRQQQDAADRLGAQATPSHQYQQSDRSPEDASKKQSRLSPEERRALRRQINEAGQDLYIPKR